MSEYADCSSCGECCTTFPVDLTRQELEELQRARPDLAAILRFVEYPAERIFEISPPCPFRENGKCAVWNVKPFSCTSFLCGRVDTSEVVNPDRMDDPEFRKIRDPYYKKGLAWARSHGWPI